MDEADILKMFPNREALERAKTVIANADAVAIRLGHLAMSWVGVDEAVDNMFEPLLQCSEAQVACILVENISTRCEMIKKLLHLETELPGELTDWICGLLNRASGELADARNRHIHDAWHINESGAVRRDKRAKLGKPQSRQRRQLTFNTIRQSDPKEIEKLEDRVMTVLIALHAACNILRRWRSEGQPPPLDPQWLPACKPNARFVDYRSDPRAPERPLLPLRYEFD